VVDRIRVLTNNPHLVEIFNAKVRLIAQHRFQERTPPHRFACLCERPRVFEALRALSKPILAGIRLEDTPDDFRLPLVWLPRSPQLGKHRKRYARCETFSL
jgi:hypothetical protein